MYVDNTPSFFLPFMSQPNTNWPFYLPFFVPKDGEETDEEKLQIPPITIHKLSIQKINLIHSYIFLFCNLTHKQANNNFKKKL